MLSIGWPEMLVVAAAALIVVGPRDLPALLRNIGQAMGKVRRMSSDFRAEINKVAAIDDVRQIKKSITQPLAQSRADIESQFNKITPTGFEPSGKLQPRDPNSESVFEEIKAATSPITENAGDAAANAVAKAVPAPKKASAKPTAAKSTTKRPAAVANKKGPRTRKPAARKAPVGKTTTSKPKTVGKRSTTPKAKPAGNATPTKKPAARANAAKTRVPKSSATKA